MNRIVHPQDLSAASRRLKPGCAILLIHEQGVLASEDHWLALSYEQWLLEAARFGLSQSDLHYIAEFDGVDYFAAYCEQSPANGPGVLAGAAANLAPFSARRIRITWPCQSSLSVGSQSPLLWPLRRGHGVSP